MSTVLKVENLHLSIQSSSILNGVNLELSDGDTVGLIGPNGSGKTTLFNCLSGFLHHSSGSITFNEREISKLRPHQRAKIGIGRVFQNFGIFRDLTVEENILAALEGEESLAASLIPWGKKRKDNRDKIHGFLEDVGLSSKAQDKAGSLSGGQMRLLEMARTLAFGAELFLLDEPTAGVAPKMKNDIAEIIVKLQNLGKTILIIEHDMNFIQKFCKRIAVLDSGKVVLEGAPQEVRDDEKLQQIYFGEKV